MRKKLIWIIPAAIVGIVVFSFLGGLLVMYLWNWLTPSLFGWHQITFWQAFGILALCRILFGGHGFRGPRGPRFRDRMRGRCGSATPEEREKFRQAMRERWGFGGPSTEEHR
jgi:MFS family permease